MERGAVWVEVFLLLFGEEEFLGFRWQLLVLEAVHRRDTPPAPLERGGSGCLFLVGKERFEAW